MQVRDAFGKVEKAVENPSAAGDVALIFNFMKMLDPGSVVREGEFATAETAAGVPAQIRNLYNRVLTGERLNVTQRQDFLNASRNVFASQRDIQLQQEDQYRGIAGRLGMDPQNVVVDYLGKYRDMELPISAVPGEEAQPPQVNSKEEYRTLPSGAQYIDPSGVLRTKP